MKSPLTSILKAACSFLSGVTLCAFMVFGSGCEIGEIDLGFNGPATQQPVNEIVPGEVWADSIVSYAEGDSIYGHFNPLLLNNTPFLVVEFGFYIYSNNARSIISLEQDVEWRFVSADSIIICSARIPRVTANVRASFTVFMRYKDVQGNIHNLESTEILIREFEPAFRAEQDSVTFPESGKAILWGHLEATMDCEVVELQIESWPRGYNPTTTTFTPIQLPYALKATEVVQIRDTIEVIQNWEYTWIIRGTAVFTNDSLGTVSPQYQLFTTD